MSITFEDVRPLLEQNNPEAVRNLFLITSQAERSAIVAPLKNYARDAHYSQVPALYVAGAGSFPTAVQLAKYLFRSEFQWTPAEFPTELLLATLRDRGVSWIPELVTILAGKLTDEDLARWYFVVGLAHAAGVPVPTTEPFVKGWVQAVGFSTEAQALDRLRSDPFLTVMVPRIFDVDGVGSDLVRDGIHYAAAPDPGKTIAGVLPALAAEGRLDREMLLDGCLGRFLRGETAHHIRGFVGLYRALAPSAAEVSVRVNDLMRLLPDAHSSVASAVQASLRSASKTGHIAPEIAIEAGRAVLTRNEKKLFRDQVTWLQSVAMQYPDQVDDVCETLSIGFGSTVADLAECALDAAMKHHDLISDRTQKLLAEAAETLPVHLRDKGAFALPDISRVVVAAPPVAQAFPEAISSPLELAEEISAMWAGPADAIALERVLAGVVHFAATDRPAMVDALTPVMSRLADYHRGLNCGSLCLHWHLGEMLRQILGMKHETWWWKAARALTDGSLPAALVSMGGVHRILALRIVEIGVRRDMRPVPALVATPTRSTGHIDPAVLVDRLADAERGDWQPWAYDLSQALLRLPREVDGDAVMRAQRLTSPAGKALAARLAAGEAPQPLASRKVLRPHQLSSGESYPSGVRQPTVRVQVGLSISETTDLALGHLGTLHSGDSITMVTEEWANGLVLWPSVAPSHRDAVAAWALRHLARLADEDIRGGATILPILAETSGPVGPGMVAALAYGLAAKQDTDRVAASDAFLTLSAAGDLPEESLGAELGFLIVEGVAKVNRVVAALTDIARFGGAREPVWDVLAACLPAVLAADPVPRGTPDILSLAAETAAVSRIRKPVQGLAEVAARPGKSRLVIEAKRLAAWLDQ